MQILWITSKLCCFIGPIFFITLKIIRIRLFNKGDTKYSYNSFAYRMIFDNYFVKGNCIALGFIPLSGTIMMVIFLIHIYVLQKKLKKKLYKDVQIVNKINPDKKTKKRN